MKNTNKRVTIINFRQALKDKQPLFFDGSMGYMLQTRGLKTGELPERMNIEHGDIVQEIHAEYINAGSDIITVNSFGAFDFKYNDLEDIIAAAVNNVKSAVREHKAFIAFDIGPTGKLLAPMGDLSFDDCLSIYRRTASIAAKNGVDLFIIETMSDLYEIKAAIIAAKETGLPIVCTATFDKTGHTLTGADPKCVSTLVCSLGVDVVGVNCGYGPEVTLGFIDEFLSFAPVRVLCQPNAGLPEMIDGKAVYSCSPEEYASLMLRIYEKGVSVLGGCCGTTPAHIKAMTDAIKQHNNAPTTPSRDLFARTICSYSQSLTLGADASSPESFTVGCIHVEPDADPYDILDEAMEYVDDEVDIIELCFGGIEVDTSFVSDIVQTVQSAVKTPLSISTDNADVAERALLVYNGRPLVNLFGLNGQARDTIQGIAVKYGALTSDYDNSNKTGTVKCIM